MTLDSLISALNDIKKRFPETDKLQCEVERYDDNVLDGHPIEGVRVAFDVNSDNEMHANVFIIFTP